MNTPLLAENEWRTKTSALTDAEGYVKLGGFKGGYEISCMGKTAAFQLDGKEGACELKLG